MKKIIVLMLLIIFLEVIERWYNRIKNCRVKIILSTVNNYVDKSDNSKKELAILKIDILPLLTIITIVFLASQIEKDALFKIVCEALLEATLSLYLFI
ncbi:hypothetical protein K5X77_10125 (plasmid) [Vagococcus lutrae]|uniref:hypothetical protein n=1 Tax=Vagococcus lutrae TaxID=81947 RepID=UPI001C98B044|nr:hypothetical protein [Vagococcus lutrae]QZN89767.1 hypothetical protein K5X77_10125 [Vagococcus lutrae]